MLNGIQETVGMGMMGMGGLLAAIGGLLFLIIAISALTHREAAGVALPSGSIAR